MWKRAEQISEPGIYLVLNMEEMSDPELPHTSFVKIESVSGKLVVVAHANYRSSLENYINERDTQPHVFFGPITLPTL